MIILELVFVIISGFLLSVYGMRIRKIIKKERDVSDIMSSVIIPFEKKVDQYNEKIIDLLFRVDLLEARQVVVTDKPLEGSVYVNPLSPKSSDITKTELAALTTLINGPKTPREIQFILGKTREHVARVMKKMFEDGYVTRDEGKKPFVYKLTDSGLSLVKEVGQL